MCGLSMWQATVIMDISKVINNLRQKAASLQANVAGFSGDDLEKLLNEASAALKKAKELAEKYGYDETLEADEVGGLVFEPSLMPKTLSRSAWFEVLISLAADIFPIRLVSSGRGNSIVIFGQENDCLAALELLENLCAIAERFMSNLTLTAKNDYLLGYMLGCQEILVKPSTKLVKRLSSLDQHLTKLAQPKRRMQPKNENVQLGYHDGLHHQNNRLT